MEYWQVALLTFFVLLPFSLLFGFWPDNERLTSRGRPIERDWDRQVDHAPADEDHH